MIRTPLVLTMLVAGLAVSGCGRKIGDSCSTNIDCHQDGTRICDLSQPGGYCTEDGCDENSCPSESICVRFFDQAFATVSCDEQPCPTANEVCVTQKAGSASPGKVCAPAASERRFCAEKCNSDGDCRSAYSCQAAGTYGSLALLKDPADLPEAKFCSPTPKP